MLERPAAISTGHAHCIIDVEVQSSANLPEVGASRYAADPTTTILVVAFAIDDQPVELWYPDQAPLSQRLAEVAADPEVRFIAHNAPFEIEIARKILTPRYGMPEIALERWVCTMTTASVVAMPPDLEKLALALGLQAKKDSIGKRLMRQMSRPAAPGRDDTDRLLALGEYCRRDVEATREAFYTLPALSDEEQRLWLLNARINSAGVPFDRPLVIAARGIAERARPELDAAMAEATDGVITTCNQVKRLVVWLNERGCPVDSVDKETIEKLLGSKPTEQVGRVLELRRAGAVNAVAKFDAILAGLESDNRAYGLFLHHRASTGRASSHRIQVQNLKHTTLDDPEPVIAAVKTGDIEQVRALGQPLDLLADLVRPSICAPSGRVLVGVDFSAIESRGLASIANEERKLRVYRDYDRTGDPDLEPYLVVAKWLNPYQPNRSLGKISDLAFGYQGGVRAFRAFEPDKLNPMPEAKVEELKLRWRAEHPNIERFWFAIERAAIEAVFRPGVATRCGRIRFKMIDGTLYMQLPSGRLLAYPQARLEYNSRRRKQVVFKDNASGQWRDDVAYGGQLTENAVSGICRDLLTAAMLRIDAAGIQIIAHIHDELICEVDEGAVDLDRLVKLMVEPPPWADGFPIAAKAWAGRRYTK